MHKMNTRENKKKQSTDLPNDYDDDSNKRLGKQNKYLRIY